MASFSAFVRRAPLPAVATYLYQTQWIACEAEKPAVKVKEDETFPSNTSIAKPPKTAGMQPSEEGDYHGLFPKSQLWQPKNEYPLWDDDWDGRKPESTGDKTADRELMRHIRKTGVTRCESNVRLGTESSCLKLTLCESHNFTSFSLRHIILIRHGQYDETYKVRRRSLLASYVLLSDLDNLI